MQLSTKTSTSVQVTIQSLQQLVSYSYYKSNRWWNRFKHYCYDCCTSCYGYSGRCIEGKITNLQKLSIAQWEVTATVTQKHGDDIPCKIAAETGAAGTLGLTNMANNGTLELTAATNATGDVTVTITDATSLTSRCIYYRYKSFYCWYYICW